MAVAVFPLPRLAIGDRCFLSRTRGQWLSDYGVSIHFHEYTSPRPFPLVEPPGSRDPSEVDGVDSSITGVNVQGMVLKNAGKECLRIRYFATNCVVQVNEIGPCGIQDFQQDSDGSNGEGVCEYWFCVFFSFFF